MASRLVFSFVMVLVASSCRYQPTEGQASNELGFFKDLWFCRKYGFAKCQNSARIVHDANVLASSYFIRDVCATDGQRDAFRHIYGMVWISTIFGNDFAVELTFHSDPDPAGETNPQIVCQRKMDIANNAFGILNAEEIMEACNVQLSSPPNFQDYLSFDEKVSEIYYKEGFSRYADCVGGEVADFIVKSTADDPDGPFVIDRNPSDATVCWLVPASQEVSRRGRTQCDDEY